ncbi:MAG: 3-isopropylmalate dehydratase small subunit [Spirochaetales bacterium]|nr:3-isopropylmalate dehydratase small subunit [Spirochaetales bacterium]
MNTVITELSGKGIPIRGNEIDTDRIIPARFMKCVTFAGLGAYAFYDERYNDNGTPKNHVFDRSEYEGHSILAVNKNFGCGSSREHAPQALKDYGIKAIIGESFAEIFAGNCTALGIPAVQLSEQDIHEVQAAIEQNPSLELRIDLSEKMLQAGDTAYPIHLPDAFRNSFLDGTWDSTALLLSGKKEIERVYASLPYLAFNTASV